MKIGVIYCCYGNPEYINDCLSPWLEAKKSHNILIAATHGQFKEYHEMGIQDDDTKTEWALNEYYRKGLLDYLYIQNPGGSSATQIYQSEADIRNYGLQYLLDQDCDYIWLWDGDEITDINEIQKTIEFIQKDEFICWYRTEYKNLTFTENCYTIGFKPPRIFKTNYGNCKLLKFYWDNDLLYKNIDTNQEIDYKLLPSCDVPRTKFFAKHYTWLNDGRSKNKILYQEKHFKGGAGCAFKWADNQLKWNEKYFELTKQSIPELFKD